jgi:23S rRNA (uracil1939-C5)-methyltransferase
MIAPRIVTPSPDRVAAPCPHYRACGGCGLMHVRDRFVEDWKRSVVRDALAAQGLATDFGPTATSPARTRRRATFAGRRTKAGAIAGFHARASGSITDVPGCRVLAPDLISALPALRRITALGASRSRALDLTVTLTDSGLDVAVSGEKDTDSAFRATLATAASDAGLARLSWNGETLAQRAAPTVTFGAARVPLPPGAFLQATVEGEVALAQDVAETVGDARRVADLFAGCGTFALRLADRAEVHAVEGDAAMVAALDAGWRAAPGLHRVTTERRDLFRRPLLADELSRFDAVVIDPPRAGAEAQVVEIARSGLRRLAYVSCNPVTFARDARILSAGGLRLARVRVVDQFRWSPHVELVAAFDR